MGALTFHLPPRSMLLPGARACNIFSFSHCSRASALIVACNDGFRATLPFTIGRVRGGETEEAAAAIARGGGQTHTCVVQRAYLFFGLATDTHTSHMRAAFANDSSSSSSVCSRGPAGP